MPATFEHTFDHDSYKGKTSFSTGLFIGGEVRRLIVAPTLLAEREEKLQD